MADAKKCDICYGFYDPTNTYIQKNILKNYFSDSFIKKMGTCNVADVKISIENNNNPPGRRLDICPKCMNDILSVFKKKSCF